MKKIIEIVLALVLIPAGLLAQTFGKNSPHISVESASGGTVSLITHSANGVKVIVNDAETGGWSGAGVPYTAAGQIESKAATGNSQGTAAALTATKTIHVVTASDETTAVVLPACAAADIGKTHQLFNTVANKFLTIYPAGSDAINAIAASSAYTSDATGVGRHRVTCICAAAAQWYCG